MRCFSHFSRQTRYTSASRRARQLAGARAALALVSGRWKMALGGIPCLPACPALVLSLARCVLGVVACCCCCCSRRRLSRACSSGLLPEPSRPRPSLERWVCRCFTASPSHSLPLPRACVPSATSRRASLSSTSRVKYGWQRVP
jgi:hypothetical protein